MQKVKLDFKPEEQFKIQSIEQYQRMLDGGGRRDDPTSEEIDAFKSALVDEPEPVKEVEAEAEAQRAEIEAKAKEREAIERKETDRERAHEEENRKKAERKKEGAATGDADAEQRRIQAVVEAQKILEIPVVNTHIAVERPAVVEAPSAIRTETDAVRTPTRPARFAAEEILPTEAAKAPDPENAEAPREFHGHINPDNPERPEARVQGPETVNLSYSLPKEEPVEAEQPLPAQVRIVSEEPGRPAPADLSLKSFPTLSSLLKDPSMPMPDSTGSRELPLVPETPGTLRTHLKAAPGDEEDALPVESETAPLPSLGLVLDSEPRPATSAAMPARVETLQGRGGHEGRAPSTQALDPFADPQMPALRIPAGDPAALGEENPLMPRTRAAISEEVDSFFTRHSSPQDRPLPFGALPKAEVRSDLGSQPVALDPNEPELPQLPEDAQAPKVRATPERTLPEAHALPEGRPAPKEAPAPKGAHIPADLPETGEPTLSGPSPLPEAEVRLASKPAVTDERPEKKLEPDAKTESREKPGTRESEELPKFAEPARPEARSEGPREGVGPGGSLPKNEWDKDGSKGSGKDKGKDKDDDQERIILRRKEEKNKPEDIVGAQWAPPTIPQFNVYAPIQAPILHVPHATPFTKEVTEMVSRLLVTADPFSDTQQVRMTLNDDLLPGAEIRFKTEGGVLKLELHGADARTAEILEQEAGGLKSALEASTGGEVEVTVFGNGENRGAA